MHQSEIETSQIKAGQVIQLFDLLVTVWPSKAEQFGQILDDCSRDQLSAAETWKNLWFTAADWMQYGN